MNLNGRPNLEVLVTAPALIRQSQAPASTAPAPTSVHAPALIASRFWLSSPPVLLLLLLSAFPYPRDPDSSPALALIWRLAASPEIPWRLHPIRHYTAYKLRASDYARRRTVTPAVEDPHGIRARSLSNASEQRVPFVADTLRRTPAVDSYASPPASPPPPPPPSYEAAQPGSRGHLSFGDASAPQYATPRHYPHQGPVPPPPVSPSRPYPSSQSPYGYHHGRTMSSAAMSSAAMSSAYPSPAPSAKPEPYDRASGSYVTPSPSAFSTTEAHPRRSSSNASYPATPLLPAPPKRTLSHQLQHPSLAPLKIASLVSPLPPIEAQTEPLQPPPAVSTGGKRKHEIVFQQCLQPLHNGRRQQDPHYAGRRGAAPDPGQGMYSRADDNVGVVTFSQWQ